MLAPLPVYDRSQTYRWNYDHAPELPPQGEAATVAGNWTFCGRRVGSPLGVAAGPLLNGRWVLYYAALGFDVLTYKTTRSQARECYPLPNLQPVAAETLSSAGKLLATSGDMLGSWAISFGMPSMAPDVWRADVEWTRSRLPKDKLLSVSVVATPKPGWTVDELAADFSRCARWAVESGADCVETNFSCPNVDTSDGQLYQQPLAAARVAQQVRAAIGTTPYVVKLGFVPDDALTEQLVEALEPSANALAMTNCISAKIHNSAGEFLFGGQPRGIGGDSIREASIDQVRRFSRQIRQRGSSLRVIGVGGISTAQDVRAYLSAGAEAVQLATAVMIRPEIGLEIRRDLSPGGP